MSDDLNPSVRPPISSPQPSLFSRQKSESNEQKTANRLNMFYQTRISVPVPGMDETALQVELERSRASRLRAWAVLGELRAILTGAGQELPKPSEKSFVEEGRILEQGLRKALTERDEVLRELATPPGGSIERSLRRSDPNTIGVA